MLKLVIPFYFAGQSHGELPCAEAQGNFLRLIRHFSPAFWQLTRLPVDFRQPGRYICIKP